MTTTSELIASARIDIADPSSTVFTDAQMLDYLNRGFRQVHEKLVEWDADIIRARQTIAVTSGDDAYDLPAGYWLTCFMYIDGEANHLIQLKADALLKYPVTQTGTPFGYLISGTEIILRWMPNATKTLYHYHYIAYSNLALLATTPFNGLFDQVARQFVASMALNRNEYNTQVELAILKYLEESAWNIMNKRLPSIDITPWDTGMRLPADYPFGS